jgi:hypothetical protein
VNRLTRYCRYAVLGLLVPGVPLAIVAWSKVFWNEYPDRSWVAIEHVAGILCSVGLLIWFCLIIGRIGSDVAKLWKKSKAGLLLTVSGVAALALALHRFVALHFDPRHIEAPLFFWPTLLLGSYLLLRTSVFLTDAGKN